jgi:uncharacterized membrane protein HdeD (DUF308 family)
MDGVHEVTETPDEVLLQRRRAGWGAHNWGWLLGVGVAAVVLGIVVLSHAFGSLSVLVWLTGLFLIVMGATELLAVARSEVRGSRVAGGLIAVAGGIIMLAWPSETLKVLVVLAGITLLAWGALSVLTALRSRREGQSPVSGIALGVGLIALAIVVLAWPAATITIVGILVGLGAIAWGAMTAWGALELREAGRRLEEQHRRAREASAEIERADIEHAAIEQGSAEHPYAAIEHGSAEHPRAA